MLGGAVAEPVYKICSASGWQACAQHGALPDSSDDARDGYVHLSSAAQVRGSCARHFAGQRDLWLLELDPAALADGALRWESARDGQLFPHLYGELRHAAVVRADRITVTADGFEMPAWCPNPQPAAGGIDSTRTPEPPAKP